LSKQAKAAARNPEGADVEQLESTFDEWFQHLDDYHKDELLRAIAGSDE
jgi:hypothetical protein